MDPTSFALLRSGLFSGLGDAAFLELVRQARLVEVREGDRLVREGDPADAFFVVLSGRLQVFTETPSGQSVVLTHLEPGQHFGEQALLEQSGRRTASVRGFAKTSEVARLGREHLAASLASSPELEQALRSLGQRQQDEKLARRTSLVRELLSGTAMSAKERPWRNGQVLYREGDPAGLVYVVLSGHIELFVERDGSPVRVARIGPGLCAGERDEKTRAATAISDGDSRLLEVSREELVLRAAESPELSHHLATLQRVWELPQRGYVTQYAGDLDGRPCLTQMFHLRGGRRVVSTHVVGAEQVRLQSSEGEPVRWISTPNQQIRVGLESDGRVWGVEAQSTDPVLGPLFARAIAGEVLAPAEENELTTRGVLARELDVMLCACLRVSKTTVQSAIGNGLVTLSALQERTGCGTSCGSCIPAVVELLGQASFTAATVTQIQELTPDVRKLVFAPANGAPANARPGQHVVVRVKSAGKSVERPYTLSGAPGGPWEITVKREEGGAFSQWLFEEARVGAKLEASAAMGSYFWDSGPAPIVCFVSGIGVTPALAFARTLLREGWPHRLVIDWSTRHERDTAILGELPKANASNLTLNTRITSKAGRLKPAEIRAWAERFPSAIFYLCGSEGFMSEVAACLLSAGVPASRTRIEHFNREALA